MKKNETNTQNTGFIPSLVSMFFSPPDSDDETTLTEAQSKLKLADAITAGNKKKVVKYLKNVSLDALPVPALLLAINSNKFKVNSDKLAMISYLLDDLGANVSLKSSQKISPLMAAAAEGNLEAVNILLSYSPLIDDIDNNGYTALMITCSKQGEQYYQCAEALINAGAQVNHRDSDNNTPLMITARARTPDYSYETLGSSLNNQSITQLLLHHDANPDFINKQGQTALDLSKKSNTPLVAALILGLANQEALDYVKKAFINTGTFCHQLKKAIDKDIDNRAQIIEICSIIDIDTINARRRENRSNSYENYTCENETLLEYAVAEKKSLDIITLLLKAQAKPAVGSYSGYSSYTHPLMLTDDEKIIDLLLEYGADINTTDSLGNTKLHRAVQNGSLDNSIYLISKGADLSKKNKASETAYIIAAKMGREDLMSLLGSSLGTQALELQKLELLDSIILSGNTKLFTSLYADKSLSLLKDSNNKTVLHYCHNGRLKLEMLDLLLPKLAPNELNAIDNYGLTPMFVLFYTHSEKELAPLFMKHGANPNYGRSQSAPLLSYAILNGMGAIESLLQAGANPALTDDKGNNALHIFVENKRNGAYGFNFWNQIATRDTVNALNKAGMTSLDIALSASYPSTEIIERLIEAGADPKLLSFKAKEEYRLWEESRTNVNSYRW